MAGHECLNKTSCSILQSTVRGLIIAGFVEFLVVGKAIAKTGNSSNLKKTSEKKMNGKTDANTMVLTFHHGTEWQDTHSQKKPW